MKKNDENLRNLRDSLHKCRTKTFETGVVENQTLGLVGHV